MEDGINFTSSVNARMGRSVGITYYLCLPVQIPGPNAASTNPSVSCSDSLNPNSFPRS